MICGATILWGANNIFQVILDEPAGTEAQARIKGKVLTGNDAEHNPLAPGDRVSVQVHPDGAHILERHDRRNRVYRWNGKRQKQQTLAANVDQVVVVSSVSRPAAKPRFIDRVLAMAELESIPAIVVVNKIDLGQTDTAYISILRALAYPVFETSVVKRTGLVALTEALRKKTTVLIGQSGVGKSSLINAVFPSADQKTGTVSDRFDRGRHTTTTARRILVGDGMILIDTPGVREFDLYSYETTEIAAGFREFRPLIPDCRMPSCSHTHEPGCAVTEALRAGKIEERRYDSYLRIIEEIDGMEARS